MKKLKFQQITSETNPTKLLNKRGWMVITKEYCIGLYETKREAIYADLSPIAIVPCVVDYYVGDGL